MHRLIQILLIALMFPAVGYSQQYVGDNACSGCHANMPERGFFENYTQTGHPYKLNRVVDGQAPTWPHSDPPPLPMVNGEQLTWNDVSYVIGNYFWKARFMNRQGYIITGGANDRTQWNIATQQWVPYNAGRENMQYNCGTCHTTGFNAEGNQDGLQGIAGTWSEPGIRCEACHGPGSVHITAPGQNRMPGGKACAECHYRDAQFRMPWKSGFMEHHQQSEDFAHSPHNEIEAFSAGCNTCHNPHKSTLNRLGGLKEAATCTNCHTDRNYLVQNMEGVSCADCHMPFIGKSAVAYNAYRGDVRGHLFTIMTEPIRAVQNVDTIEGKTYWRQNQDGSASATIDYACMSCHVDGDIQQLADYARDIHIRFPSNVGSTDPIPFSTSLSEAYPNPFNGSTRMSFSLSTARNVRVDLIDMAGRSVATLADGYYPQGTHNLAVDGAGLTSGIYLARFSYDGLQMHRKLILTK